MTWILMVAGILACVVIWLTIFVLLPRYLRLSFSLAILKLRDELVRDIIEGRLPEALLVEQVQQNLELAARYPEDFTLANILLVGWTTRDSHLESVDLPARQPDRRLTRDQLGLLSRYQRGLYSAAARQALFGSPSGWFGLPLFPVYLVGEAFISWIRSRRFISPRTLIERAVVQDFLRVTTFLRGNQEPGLAA